MDLLSIFNLLVTISYYLITAFFLYAILRTFIKTKNRQHAITYCLMLIPFLLRILRLK